MKVLAAMSGGVDSSVAAAILLAEGHEVIGVTLRLADVPAGGAASCCGDGEADVARGAARRLGIEHRVVDVRAAFQAEVLEPWVDGYLAGETPSPCARCNARVKIGGLLVVAAEMGAELLVTGHYARREVGAAGEPVLRRAADPGRDQSYFLFALRPEQLARVRFPLGELTKTEVRARARALGLANADRPDSQDVCFLPAGGGYVEALERLAPGRLPGSGEVVDGEGRVLGRHGGIHRFTVGQRRGLGVAAAERRYVTAIDAARGLVVVGGAADVFRRRLSLRGVNWLGPPPDGPIAALVQVRSRHLPVAGRVVVGGDTAEVALDEPVAAPAPGQAAVCYDGDRVLGGGWIAAAS